MPVKPGTPLDPEETQAKVLRAATDLFYEHGVHAVGVNEIAARAEASKLSIYRYFHSKEGLVAAMLARRSEEIQAWLSEQISSAEPGTERVLALFDRLVRWFDENGYRGCAVINTAIDTRCRDADIHDTARSHLNRYRDLLRGELAHAGYTDPDGLAQKLFVLIEGATVITSIDGTIEAGEHARRTAELLLETC